ncbi:hypothetical protein [Herbaspirillum sp. YR522]|uniref:hypothetical protein n=1 Tax=Herbaspirillum sp. YR522 TaxID=1144342 RepID=UPI00026F7677|nr:hypothetical protein [Herbaspirillum sp. YR522]EJN08150.1 hypothetical protein PMI40_01443 [Herbaspirillum sp. YR522]
MTYLYDRLETFLRRATGLHIVLALLAVGGALCWAVYLWATGEARIPFALFDICFTPAPAK